MRTQVNTKHPKGVITIEAALVLPLILFVTLGGLQFGWLFLKYQEITNIARHAVRYCSRPDVGCPETKAWIVEEMKKHGLDGYIIDNEVAWVTDSNGDAIQHDPPGDVGNPIYVKLSIRVSGDENGNPGVDIIHFFPVPDKLTAYCTMSEEG